MININERWSFIDGFNNEYIVTESGKVYSFKQQKLKELKLKSRNNPKRYISVCLSINDTKYYKQVHRLVGFCFVDGYFDGAVINHKDKNIHNNHYTNLEWVTQRENIHKSYDVLNQVRNFKEWQIIYPNTFKSPILKGRQEIIDYVANNNLPIKISMLIKHKYHNGFVLKEIDNNSL